MLCLSRLLKLKRRRIEWDSVKFALAACTGYCDLLVSAEVLSVTPEKDPVGVVIADDESVLVDDAVVCCMVVNVSEVSVDDGVVSVDENG
jgi:hypothetical protein